MSFMFLDRDQNHLFPPSPSDLLPDNHLAKFVVMIVDLLNIAPIISKYASHGKDAYPPSMLLSLLIYSYITGVFSSRAIERQTYDSISYMYICCYTHPDHSTISDFRKRFAPEIAGLFNQVLGIAQEAGVMDLGTVFLDG
ncbi:MAG: transposase, partial [Deltaproteobacteria bacterium]|nr:transposase [Deltaproteobacteria bacterium]